MARGCVATHLFENLGLALIVGELVDGSFWVVVLPDLDLRTQQAAR